MKVPANNNDSLRSHPMMRLLVFVLSLGLAGSLFALPELPPQNPYLADSDNAIAHRNSAQQDSSSKRGPEGPTRALAEFEIDWFFLGPGHFGENFSSPDSEGRRIGWTSGVYDITKFDPDTHQILASYELRSNPFTEASSDAALASVYGAPIEQQPMAALQLTASMMKDMVGVYTLVDRDGDFYVSGHSGITVYGSAEPDDRRSAIVVKRRWQAPDGLVSGHFTVMNMTFDGWLVLLSEDGDVVALKRDFSDYRHIKMRYSEQAAAYRDYAQSTGRRGYTWVRNSFAIDPSGGIYIVSAGYLHKVIWDGDQLSTRESDGAWSVPYPDGTGYGSGATPALMGFGPDEDHLIVFTDGDPVMNVVAYWRDAIPEGWEPLPGAPSERMAGRVRADMGDPNAIAVQTEQATVVGGYRAIVVNNAPATVPAKFPQIGISALIGLLGTDPRYTPHGMQCIAWDAQANLLTLAWTSQVASPNTVPFISLGSGLVYTIGARDGHWTLEGLDLESGAEAFHYTLPTARYNGFFSGVQQNDAGDISYGTPFGRARIRR